MIIRAEIKTDCNKCLSYQNKTGWHQLDKYKNRFSEYEKEKLLEHIEFDSQKDNLYLYKILYSDGSYSVAYSLNKPIGKLQCRKCA
jgi:hypothetical protein